MGTLGWLSSRAGTKGMHPASHLSGRCVFLCAVYMLVSVCHPSGVPANTPQCEPTELSRRISRPPRPGLPCILHYPWKGYGPGEGSRTHRAPMGSAHPSILVWIYRCHSQQEARLCQMELRGGRVITRGVAPRGGGVGGSAWLKDLF